MEILTQFFHYKANQRRRKNTIHGIKDDRGNLWRDSQHIDSIFDSYFKNSFTSSTTTYNSDIFSVVQDRVTHDMCNLLDSDYTTHEIYSVIKDLKSNSAPGPDGLTALFFQKY